MLLQEYAQKQKLELESLLMADAEMISFVEKILAGAIGSASARLLISSTVKEAPLTIQQMMTVLDETQQLMTYSKELEQKSQELEQATLELQEANIQLQEMDRLKDEFITTVTHELRMPMTSIRSFSNILYSKEDLDPQRKQEFLSIIIKESERITRLINQVLDLEKIESGHAKWEMEEMDFRAVIHLASKSMQSWIKEEHIAFEMKLPNEVVAVKGDFDRLVQVVVNLLSNAVKFCDEAAGEVRMTLTVEEDCCCLQVKDNGIGIAAEDQAYIFNKFSQLSEYKSGRQQGSGLGLSISQRIVQHHKGRIWVESELGKGSCFFLELPIFKRSFEFPKSEN
jgi:signal transduction histidine kinase